MPKVQTDPQLHEQIQSLVRQCGGNVSEAARLLDVNKASLWRFHESGMALLETRKRYRDALAKISRKNETAAPHSFHDANAGLYKPVALDRAGRVMIKRICEGLIALVDSCESDLAANGRAGRQ